MTDVRTTGKGPGVGTLIDTANTGQATREPSSLPPREYIEPGAFAALKIRFFATYLATLSLSMSGMWVRVTAMGFLVYDLTDDPFKLGLIAFTQSAPQLIMAPVAGAYLDRLDRRKVLLTIQAVLITTMLAITALIFTDHITYGWLMVAAVVVGCCAAFDWPARLTLVPRLVDRPRLPSAVALNAATFNGAKVLGPTIAGWLIAATSVGFAFGYTALAPIPYVLVILSMAAMPPDRTGDQRNERPFASLMDGYRYAWRHPQLRTMLSVDVVPIMLGMSYIAMAPAVARDVLDSESKGLGYLLTANGIGSLLGTVLVAHLAHRRNRGRIVLIAGASFATFLMAFALSDIMALSLALICLLGFCYATESTMNDTLIQTHVDDAYRGRVYAIYSTFWGLSPAGGLLAGLLATWIGVQWSLAINGLLVLAYMVYLALRTPLREID